MRSTQSLHAAIVGAPPTSIEFVAVAKEAIARFRAGHGPFVLCLIAEVLSRQRDDIARLRHQLAQMQFQKKVEGEPTTPRWPVHFIDWLSLFIAVAALSLGLAHVLGGA